MSTETVPGLFPGPGVLVLPPMPPEAHTLGALVIAPDGWARLYRAKLEREGLSSVVALVAAAHRRGYAYDYRCTDDDYAESFAVIDVHDVEGDIVQDFAVPTAEAFAWWERAAELEHYISVSPDGIDTPLEAEPQR